MLVYQGICALVDASSWEVRCNIYMNRSGTGERKVFYTYNHKILYKWDEGYVGCS